ncbi:MAG: hypothetical protein ABDH59_08610, partial [Fervidobacterium sp.]
MRKVFFKCFLFYLLFNLTSLLYCNNIYVFVERNLPSVYEGVNIQDELKRIFSNVAPKTFRVVHVVDVLRESYTRKVNEFVRDPQGRYVYYKGSYYYTSSYARYEYDAQKKMFVQDPRGNYVYLSDFPWARSEEDKYIISDFYRRYEKTVTETFYYLSLYVVDIDIEKFFIKSMTPITVVGNTIKDAIEKTKSNYSENVNSYSPDKIDIVIWFGEDFGKTARMFILGELQKDTRYNIYDRSYLSELFRLVAFEELMGKEVAISFRPPRYVFYFQNYVEKAEKNNSDVYYFFENPVNGRYIKRNLYFSGKLADEVPVEVEVGRYYSYDSKNKTYKLDMKEGSYVRYYKAAWEKEQYISTSVFYDFIFRNTTFSSNYLSFLINVLDAERGTLISSKNFYSSNQIALKEPIDRFGSEDVNSEYLAKVSLYKFLASSVGTFLQKVFPITSVIAETEGLKVTIMSGENVGIKKGYVFQAINDGFTAGYFNISKVSKSFSEGQVFYILPGEVLKKDSIVFETSNYPTNSGLTMRLYISMDKIGFEAG